MLDHLVQIHINSRLVGSVNDLRFAAGPWATCYCNLPLVTPDLCW